MKNYRVQNGCYNCKYKQITLNGMMCNSNNYNFNEECNIIKLLETLVRMQCVGVGICDNWQPKSSNVYG